MSEIEIKFPPDTAKEMLQAIEEADLSPVTRSLALARVETYREAMRPVATKEKRLDIAQAALDELTKLLARDDESEDG